MERLKPSRFVGAWLEIHHFWSFLNAPLCLVLSQPTTVETPSSVVSFVVDEVPVLSEVSNSVTTNTAVGKTLAATRQSTRQSLKRVQADSILPDAVNEELHFLDQFIPTEQKDEREAVGDEHDTNSQSDTSTPETRGNRQSDKQKKSEERQRVLDFVAKHEKPLGYVIIANNRHEIPSDFVSMIYDFLETVCSSASSLVWTKPLTDVVLRLHQVAL
jgi:hypothetical protein